MVLYVSMLLTVSHFCPGPIVRIKVAAASGGLHNKILRTHNLWKMDRFSSKLVSY